jgi:Zn-dependent metalloprotease
MSHCCFFVPPHVLANIARVQARESLEPSTAQRSSLVSQQIRHSRVNAATGVGLGYATLTTPKAPKALTVPSPGTAGRLIYDDQNQFNFDVKLVRGEGDPAVAGENANRAYDDLGLIRQFYKDKLGRNSIDNAGLNMVANVNYGTQFDNAFWDGMRMVFGNGDGVIFKDFTGDIDVPGHELTHGVTQYTAGLNYTPDQTGALNELGNRRVGQQP